MEEKLREEIKKLLEELENKDSIEIGNSKTGTFKVYLNVANMEEAKSKIQNAKKLMLEAREGVL
uniref:Uncharacterized protein n=1 Tax=viral metagenome TaxID=1070528 RepID=A0A6M3LMT2_9ZZZZ